MTGSGKTTKGGRGQEAADPALRLRPPEHRLPLQRQAAGRHDQEAHQDHQGGARQAEGEGGGMETLCFLIIIFFRNTA